VNTIPGVTFRPIERWPGTMTPAAERWSRYRFPATWQSTVNLLDHELCMADARNIVLQLDLTEADLRRDGLPRARANPGHPGIILAFEIPNVGPVQRAVDRYDHWQANLRAVALTMEKLRAVERYGVISTQEQYRGWAALPPPAANRQMTVEAAARFLAEQATAAGAVGCQPIELIGASKAPAERRRYAYHLAAQRLHPDTEAGDREAWECLAEAKRLLDQHGGGQA
jgi:hypothetical protein